MPRTFVSSIVTLMFLSAGVAPARAQGVTEEYLLRGKLAEGEKALTELLAKNPKDAQARFGLGATQFVHAVERLVQSFQRYGMRDLGGGGLPFLRLPIPANPNPSPVRYEDIRAIFATFLADVTSAEATLALVDDPAVKLPLHFGLIRLDLDGDGTAGEDETLWKIYERLIPNGGASEAKAKAFVIAFDRGDVAWLRGYCHLLSAFAEFYLAHDGRELFEHSAHLIFARPQTPFPFLKPPADPRRQFDFNEIADLVATVHVLRMPVTEPKKMASALAHLEAVVKLSRESWKFYEAETDDDNEWIPNPKQSTVMPGGQVTEEMIKGWREFLDEADVLLAGKLLVPFWRAAGGRGINFRRVFTEPKGFDLVLWVQGTAAAPYLEQGPVTKPELWQRLQRVFRGGFVGFAVWFN